MVKNIKVHVLGKNNCPLIFLTTLFCIFFSGASEGWVWTEVIGNWTLNAGDRLALADTEAFGFCVMKRARHFSVFESVLVSEDADGTAPHYSGLVFSGDTDEALYWVYEIIRMPSVNRTFCAVSLYRIESPASVSRLVIYINEIPQKKSYTLSVGRDRRGHHFSLDDREVTTLTPPLVPPSFLPAPAGCMCINDTSSFTKIKFGEVFASLTTGDIILQNNSGIQIDVRHEPAPFLPSE